jgi:hypothetical protein
VSPGAHRGRPQWRSILERLWRMRPRRGPRRPIDLTAAELQRADEVWARRSHIAATYDRLILAASLDEARRLAAETAHLVKYEDDGAPTSLHLKCPCGCGEVIDLNLSRARKPIWHLQRAPDRTTSVYPSVSRRSRCGTRFLLVRDRARVY